MSSTLSGIVPFIRDAGRPDAAEEIGRLLDILKASGWGGLLTADEALEIVVDDVVKYHRAMIDQLGKALLDLYYRGDDEKASAVLHYYGLEE